MSDGHPGGGGQWPDPEGESSVFGRPVDPGYWEEPPHPSPTRPQPQVPSPPGFWDEPPRRQPPQGPRPGERRQPPRPGQQPQRRTPGQPSGQRPRQRSGAGSEPRRPARSPGSREPSRGGGGGRGGSGGGGLPFGAGFVVGVLGLVAFLSGLVVLPWFTVADEDVTLADIRTAFEVPKTNPDDLLPDDTDTSTTLLPPDGSLPTIPSEEDVQDAVQDAVEDQVRDTAAQAAANAIDTGKAKYLDLYASTLWYIVAAGVSLAVVFSTILSPKSMALSLLFGFRMLAGVVTVAAAVVHGTALWVVFTGEGAPDPAVGIWVGVAGLFGVLLATILGPKK